jgi:hypothetical protein
MRWPDTPWQHRSRDRGSGQLLRTTVTHSPSAPSRILKPRTCGRRWRAPAEEETRQTISDRTAVVSRRGLGSLSEDRPPRRSNSIATRLDNSIASLEIILGEMAVFSQAITANGWPTCWRRSPAYRNLDQMAASAAHHENSNRPSRSRVFVTRSPAIRKRSAWAGRSRSRD